MRRREFIMLLGGSAAWPFAARAQQAVPTIGFLSLASPKPYARNVSAFLQGLGEAGYVEGQNVTIEYHWAEGRYDQLPKMAADLVRRQVTVIAASGTTAAFAAKAATTSIPIVFTSSGDPVQLGLITSLSQPRGNLTGATPMNIEVGPKRLELLHELVPTANVMALLINPANPTAAIQTSQMQAAAATLGLQLHVLDASAERDFNTAFARLIELKVGGLVISSADAFFASRSEQLAALTVRHAVPAIYQTREFAVAGGLVSYGGKPQASYYLAGIYVGRILNGAKPADLPVQQATSFELIVNLKTARTLGLTVPLPLLGRADEVIE
jgi:putative tryptophan/tyrosine transport system substrate-binding protein